MKLHIYYIDPLFSFIVKFYGYKISSFNHNYYYFLEFFFKIFKTFV